MKASPTPCNAYPWCAGHSPSGDWQDDVDVRMREHKIPLSIFMNGKGEPASTEFVLLESVNRLDGDRYLEDPAVMIGGEVLPVESAAQFAHALLAYLGKIREIAAEVAEAE